MAYQYDGTNGPDAQPQQGQGQQQQQNIFSGIQNAVQGPSGANAPPAQGQGPVTLSDASGSLGAGGGSGTGGSGPSPQISQNTAMNKQNVDALGFVQQAKGQVAPIEQNLQTQANAISANAGTPTTYTNAQVDTALQNGTTSPEYMNLMTYMQQPPPGPDLTKYKSALQNTDATIQNLGALTSDGGRMALFRDAGGADYTQGDAAYDNLLLQNDPRFQATMGQLAGDQQRLIDERQALGDQKLKDVQNTYKTAYDTNKGQLTDYLTQLRNGLNSTVDSQAQGQQSQNDSTYQTQLDAATKQGKDIISQKINELMGLENPAYGADYQNPLKDAETKLQTLLSSYDTPNGKSAGLSLTVPGTVDRNSTITGDEANKFNAISQLLGLGDRWQAGTAGAGPSASVDTGKLNQLIAEAIGDSETKAKQFVSDKATSDKAKSDTDTFNNTQPGTVKDGKIVNPDATTPDYYGTTNPTVDTTTPKPGTDGGGRDPYGIWSTQTDPNTAGTVKDGQIVNPDAAGPDPYGILASKVHDPSNPVVTQNLPTAQTGFTEVQPNILNHVADDPSFWTQPAAPAAPVSGAGKNGMSVAATNPAVNPGAAMSGMGTSGMSGFGGGGGGGK